MSVLFNFVVVKATYIMNKSYIMKEISRKLTIVSCKSSSKPENFFLTKKLHFNFSLKCMVGITSLSTLSSLYLDTKSNTST